MLQQLLGEVVERRDDDRRLGPCGGDGLEVIDVFALGAHAVVVVVPVRDEDVVETGHHNRLLFAIPAVPTRMPHREDLLARDGVAQRKMRGTRGYMDAPLTPTLMARIPADLRAGSWHA